MFDNQINKLPMKKQKKDNKKIEKGGKIQAQKLTLAIEKEFFLEALWILSSMIEKKIKKVLEKTENIDYGAGYSLEQAVKRIKYVHLSGKHPIFSGHFDIALIDDIRRWKNQRNIVLKDMQGVHVSMVRLERLAGEGERLLREWSGAAKKYKADFTISAPENS